MRLIRPLPRRLLALLPAALAGCAIATPFRRGEETATAQGQVLAVVTQATLVPDTSLHPLFWRHVALVDAAMPAQPGYLGHSRRAALLAAEAWTLSAWTDQAAMEAFVESPVHLEAIRVGMPAVSRARFARFTLASDALPPDWKQALEVLDRGGRTYA